MNRFETETELQIVADSRWELRLNQMRTDRKTRIYVESRHSSEDLVFEEFNLVAPPVGVKGEDELNDKAWKKYNRAEMTLQRRVVQQWLDDHNLDGVKVNFSRYAGCSMCPCSPGFVVDRQLLGPEGHGIATDIYIK